MQNFAAIGPFGAEIWRGGQIDPPPSKNLLSKSPVKIGLNVYNHYFWNLICNSLECYDTAWREINKVNLLERRLWLAAVVEELTHLAVQ